MTQEVKNLAAKIVDRAERQAKLTYLGPSSADLVGKRTVKAFVIAAVWKEVSKKVGEGGSFYADFLDTLLPALNEEVESRYPFPLRW